MCLLQHCICVSGPCEILSDVNAEELKAVYPLHRCLVDGDGCVFSALSPEIPENENDVGSVYGCTVMCVLGVQEWAEDAALRSTSVEDQGR